MSQQTYQGGALYELVARGVKDSYFYEDSAESVNPFSWKYDKYPAVQTETRYVRPLNATNFNRTILIDIDQYGDILQTASIHVRLPTWIPKPYSDFWGVHLGKGKRCERYSWVGLASLQCK